MCGWAGYEHDAVDVHELRGPLYRLVPLLGGLLATDDAALHSRDGSRVRAARSTLPPNRAGIPNHSAARLDKREVPARVRKLCARQRPERCGGMC
jgi:hypothetical protein